MESTNDNVICETILDAGGSLSCSAQTYNLLLCIDRSLTTLHCLWCKEMILADRTKSALKFHFSFQAALAVVYRLLNCPETFAAAARTPRFTRQPAVFRPQPGLPLCISHTNPPGQSTGAGGRRTRLCWVQLQGGQQCRRRVQWSARGSSFQFQSSSPRQW